MLRRYRFLLAAVLGAAIFMATVGPALAFSCFNTDKPEGAGSAGTATVNVVTGEFTVDPSAFNPAGQLKGAFLSVTAVLPDGTVVGQADVYAQKDLPEGAHNSGPGNTECDGKGIDDAAVCFGP